MTHLLSAGERQIDLSSPVCMGILNLTPDSFSDGAQLGANSAKVFKVDIDKVLNRAEQMLNAGAVFIDVGGESTRPGAAEVSLQEELDRVMPVVEAIRCNLDICLSVDTSSVEVINQSIAAGAELINDIRGLSRPGAIEAVSNSKAAVCLMHMQGRPRIMQDSISYENVFEEVKNFLLERSQLCIEQGIASDRIVIDPGFGFGKSVEHNYQLLANLSEFQMLGFPVLVGVSRKSMIGTVTGRVVDQRLAGSIAATAHALSAGASIIRAHDVAATVDAIRVNSAISSASKSQL